MTYPFMEDPVPPGHGEPRWMEDPDWDKPVRDEEEVDDVADSDGDD